MLGHRDGICGTNHGEQNTRLGQGGDVDGIVADAKARDDFEPIGAGNDAGGKRGNTENRGIVIGDVLDEIVFGQIGKPVALDIRSSVKHFFHATTNGHLNHDALCHWGASPL